MLLDNNLLQNVVHDSWKINPMLYFKGMLTFEILRHMKESYGHGDIGKNG